MGTRAAVENLEERQNSYSCQIFQFVALFLYRLSYRDSSFSYVCSLFMKGYELKCNACRKGRIQFTELNRGIKRRGVEVSGAGDNRVGILR